MPLSLAASKGRSKVGFPAHGLNCNWRYPTDREALETKSCQNNKKCEEIVIVLEKKSDKSCKCVVVGFYFGC